MDPELYTKTHTVRCAFLSHRRTRTFAVIPSHLSWLLCEWILDSVCVCMVRIAFSFQFKVTAETGRVRRKREIAVSEKKTSSTQRNRQHSLTKRHVERTYSQSYERTNQPTSAKRIIYSSINWFFG